MKILTFSDEKKNLFFERFDIFSMNFEGQIKKYVVIETSLQQKW